MRDHVERRQQRDGGEEGPRPTSRVRGRAAADHMPAWALTSAPSTGRTPGLQAQLTVGAVDDPLEQEADKVAEAVTGVPAPPKAPPPPPPPADDGDAGPAEDGGGGVEAVAADATTTGGGGELQMSADDGAPAAGWQGKVRSSLVGGRPLPDGVRSSLEGSLGSDLGGVRVHDDGPADTAARAVGARAFTVGNDVVFRSGEYQTGTPAGRRLLTHELTHVLQQRAPGAAAAGRVGGGARVQRDPDPQAPADDPAKAGGGPPKQPAVAFTIVPPKVMNRDEFRIWVSMELLGVDRDTAQHYAVVNRWWGTLATKGVTQAQVGKPTKFTFGASLYWRHRGGYVRSLPAEVQQTLGVAKVSPADYPQLIRIASMLTPAEWADYAARVRGRTSDLDEMEASVDRYLRWKRQRADEAEQYKELHTKLLGSESLLRQYRDYQGKVRQATHGKTVGAARGVMLVEPPTQADRDAAEAARQALTTALVDAGFKGGIPEFELAIQQFVPAFEAQALAIAMDALARYESFLFKQGELYQDDAVVGKLYDSLAPYRAAWAERDAQEATFEAAKSRYERAGQNRPGEGHLQHNKQQDKETMDAARAAGAVHHGKAVGVVQGLKGDHPLFGEDHLPTERRIRKPELAKVDKAGLKAMLAAHIAARTTDIRNTRGHLSKDPQLIYRMNNLMEAARDKLEITPGSVFHELIKEKTDAIERDKELVRALSAVLAIAFGIMTLGGGALAIVATGGLAIMGGVGIYEEYEKFRIASAAAGTGLSSEDPSPKWLIIAIGSALLDVAAFGAAVGAAAKVLRPAAAALEAGGSVDDFRKAVQLLEKQGQLDAKIARSVERAAADREAFKAATAEAVGATSKLNMIAGALNDPALYRAVVKMAATGIRLTHETVSQFILRLNKMRVDAGLAELAGKELALAKQAYREGRIQAATRTLQHSGKGVPYRVTGPHSLIEGTSVYVLKDAKGKVLYVGKGGTLDRLRSHITDPNKTQWFGEIAEVEVKSTRLTNSEALALEEDLIGQLKPQHNKDLHPFQTEFGTTTTVSANLPKAQESFRFTLEWGH